MTAVRIGIDLGGTKIEAIALGQGGETLLRRRVATPRGDYAATLQAIADLVHEIEEALGKRGTVGVATPGAISPTSGRLKNSNSVCLNGTRLAQDLEEVLRRPARIANDADCFALSEATDGAAAGLRNVFGVIVGTGTGGGVIVHGRPVSGPNAIAGEWGHNPLPWPRDDERPGPCCYCGRHGCIETFLSGPGMARDHQEVTGQAITAIEIARAATAGDPAANATLDRYAERMARALASVINLLDPEAVVLGGGLSNLDPLYSRVPTIWGGYVFSDDVATQLLQARFGDSSGVRGAAWLWQA